MNKAQKTSGRSLWQRLLILSPLLAIFISLSAGNMDISWDRLLTIFLQGPGSSIEQVIIWEVRLPRALLAGLVGAALSLSGVTFQAVLRNPLADPYLLGVSGGAALGAVTALTCGAQSPLIIPLAAFIGALVALLLVYMVAQAHTCSSHTLILSGVMVGSLAAALLLFLLWRAPADATRQAIFWLAGNLSLADPDWLSWGWLWVLIGFLLLWSQSLNLDLLTQGEETAADLGLDVGKTRLILFALAGALTACAVSLAGLVGFVGLVIPHICRLLWGPGHRLLLPFSALLGSSFLIIADAIARSLYAPAEIPVGVVTALLGAPFFLFLLRRKGDYL
ncbi:iron complex transport system permease protein [Desulfuromusa kysingii]|uniref:Iron complex transport system permease protein n=1 Tax=Desulfuromusa kysingii TaxID=37625 RepID=A0A1H3X3B8_9BACT|nr:iron ABC transporter permease [Desulfuromusa kysingii]SDZ93124.1 iron complex transport system permease protein [Desulfuromusa kysingii]